ncbi:MAG: hypothetical protein K2X02_09160 [Alphaproteobacteria bacterium]|nr:hypothetical protein [Alphaproteobacteria bacterium]
MEGIEEDKFASSTLISMPGPSFSGTTPDQESDEVLVSDSSPATSAQSSAQKSLFPHDKEKVTFKWSELEEAANDFSREDHRAQNLFHYLGYLWQENCILPDSERWRDTNRVITLPLLQEELSDNPPRRMRQGALINPLMKYGRYSEVAWKISTIIGALPSTKEALTQLSKLTGGRLYIPDTHKMREMHLRRDIFWASNTIEAERKRAAQEKADLVSELVRLKAEIEVLRAQTASSRD